MFVLDVVVVVGGDVEGVVIGCEVGVECCVVVVGIDLVGIYVVEMIVEVDLGGIDEAEVGVLKFEFVVVGRKYEVLCGWKGGVIDYDGFDDDGWRKRVEVDFCWVYDGDVEVGVELEFVILCGYGGGLGVVDGVVGFYVVVFVVDGEGDGGFMVGSDGVEFVEWGVEDVLVGVELEFVLMEDDFVECGVCVVEDGE